jgi:sugar/nucleoside kinase (ribokinase family)
VIDLPKIDYLTVGHVCHDLTPAGPVPGGTAMYSARVAQALGCRTAVLTSVGPGFDLGPVLPDIAFECVPAAQSTTFENVYTPAGRRQTVHAVAKTMTAGDVPTAWQRASIVHLGPIVHEVDEGMIRLFSNSLVGVTPQGWFRRWGADGRVSVGDWPGLAEVLPLAAAVIVSPEDLPHPGLLDEIRDLASVVVLTQQAGGCKVFHRDEMREVPAPVVEEVNPTGAGDVFAAAFFVRMYQTKGNPWEAAVFANRMAAHSVSYDSLADKLNAIKELIEETGLVRRSNRSTTLEDD